MSLAATRSPETVETGGFRPLTSYLFDGARAKRTAFTFLDYGSDPEGIARTVTWSELAEGVRSVAAELGRVTGRGGRVAVLAPQDLSYVTGFLGALHAGTVAVPLFAPEVSQHANRLAGALADCAPEVWLTSQSALAQVRALAEDHAVPMPKQIIAVDALEPDSTFPDVAPVGPDDPAYLQYTSGSTREPAGAVITHHALLSNARQAETAFGIDESWTMAGWIPFFHDMGLVQLLAEPVFSGARSVFMTPFAFVMRPVRWLRALSGVHNVLSAAPNFAFDYAVRKVKAAEREGLDLSGVRVLVNGSEPVRPATIAAFAETFGPYGFDPRAHRPSYGLAEATVFVTSTGTEGPTVTSFDRAALAEDRGVVVADGTPGALALAAAGRPVGQSVRIVHPERSTVLAEGRVGEIWVDGPNIATGYWQQPGRSAETFGGRLDGEPGSWLRTGDLGLIHEGLLYVTGRRKDLIIIDGRNHYPQDIEATVERAHPAIRRGHVAAFAVTDASGAEGAAVVAERGPHAGEADEAGIARAVRRAVSATHDVKLHGFRLVAPGDVPRTSSGKIARSAARRRHWDAS
ncbi:fatty acyl-AMP ligase [Amycolatopsis rhizosphaerae]|uniref:Fatty acyl-AMP ligase n=1 Tax=Amycolatopsis rhizosphaerae TaxID=2053003 RepID=A0A558CXS3_9PSEU|nr:fatty acyl-AMP ligase [Amycolatopsis rhizosphaerae]TVT53503.1 fatty acyl-AMP ligase [Amycolatopsis rhizosphaerae]